VQRDPQTLAFLREAGIAAEQVGLAEAGVRGNGPSPMLEKNSREALEAVAAWLDRRTTRGAPAIVQPPARPNSDSTALRLADHTYFFVGIERKKVAYGTVAFGQSGVQAFTPADVRHPYPVVLVHGGLGQAVHMMGIGRRPGWVHYFVREGYRTFVMDRPAYGRVPMHPDTFGADYFTAYGGGTNLANILRNSATAPGSPRNTGLLGEELGLQFVANESGFPTSMARHSEQWAKGAVELLGRALCVELSPLGIRVNVIAPGNIRTPMNEGLRALPGYEEKMGALTPAGRHGEPEEIAAAIVFVASDAASFVHGASWLVDGGWTAR